MLRFECTELGTNCRYVAKGNTLEVVKTDAMDLAQTVHTDLLSNMSPQQIADFDRTLTRKTYQPKPLGENGMSMRGFRR
jgi:predicted small metal-binding protein